MYDVLIIANAANVIDDIEFIALVQTMLLKKD